MHFKFVTVVAAFASIVSGAAVNLEARQTSEIVTCLINTTPSNTPNPTSGLLLEFINVILREFFDDLPPGTGVLTGATSFTGPAGGAYTVTKDIGAVGFTGDQTRDILRAWAGQTFAGAGNAGVTSWFINSVTC